MKRQAIRGLALLALLAAVIDSTASAQNTPDAVTVRDRKDGKDTTFNGLFKVTPAGFQVFSGPKLETASKAFNPDDVVKVGIGDLPGVDRDSIRSATTKEGKEEYDGARTLYQGQIKAAGKDERSRRYLEFKVTMMGQKLLDKVDPGKEWNEKAEPVVKEWTAFLNSEDTKLGWEQWYAVRACTRLQVEMRKFDDAARTWSRVSKNTNMPPDARLEASLQEIDLQIRAGGAAYSSAATAAAELAKTAAGPRKDRLVIYEITARAGADGKPLDAIPKIKAEMDKTKDNSVHATGFSMMGELYLAGKKSRDAVWEFAMVDTVLNQDKDEQFKALSRLLQLFEEQADEDQARKYRDKIKRVRATF